MFYISRSMFRWSVLASAVFCSACGQSHSPTASAAPTREDIETILKRSYDKAAVQSVAKQSLTVNGVKFGAPYVATLQEVQVDGVPDGATVTPAVVDYTVRTYHADSTRLIQRVRECKVYIGKMGDWVVKTGNPIGEDVNSNEPAQK